MTPWDEAGKKVELAVRRSLQELGIETYDFVKDIRPGAVWANEISDAIRSADFIVADISRPNSNVLYELGHAHALRKPSILLRSMDSDSQPPAALSGSLYISYDATDLSYLKNEVQRAARRYIERIGAEP